MNFPPLNVQQASMPKRVAKSCDLNMKYVCALFIPRKSHRIKRPFIFVSARRAVLTSEYHILLVLVFNFQGS